MGPRNPQVSLMQPQLHVIIPANPGRALNDSVKDRLHVGGRAADDAKYFRCCGLMLQRLAQFRIPFPAIP